MELKRTNTVYALNEAGVNFTVSGELMLGPDGRPTFNGRIMDKQAPERGCSVYYTENADGTSTLSMSGCPQCQQEAHGFFAETIAGAVAGAAKPTSAPDGTTGNDNGGTTQPAGEAGAVE